MLQRITGPIRAPFLILAPACVLLGVATAYASDLSFPVLSIVLAFLGAVAAHIAVNSLNEYHDYKSGLDATTDRTPFSGGSGTLQQYPEFAQSARFTGWMGLAITFLIGVYFLLEQGWLIIPIGIIGALIVVLYTPLFTRVPLLSLLTPGLGFGPVIVIGTHYVLTGEISIAAIAASLLPFFLVNNLLLLNQYPDLNADHAVGRRNVIMLAGRRNGALIYLIFNLLAFASIPLAVYMDWLPLNALWGLVMLPLGLCAAYGAMRYHNNLQQLMPYLGINVILNIIAPVLLAAAILVA